MEMRTLEIPVPEDLPGKPEDLTQLAKLALALRLFGLGRIDSSQGAAWVGISRADFLQESSRFGVPAVNWDADELSAEAAALR